MLHFAVTCFHCSKICLAVAALEFAVTQNEKFTLWLSFGCRSYTGRGNKYLWLTGWINLYAFCEHINKMWYCCLEIQYSC